ncbi:MAG: glycosyltransferase family 39 protein [Chloroflexi bacterium]|nr:glycosyltransferase family 39 protein [Chloroflexota bacterium]
MRRTLLLLRSVDPWLAVAMGIGAWVRFSRAPEFDNQYYTATVASMLQSLSNFVFGSFDPMGVVTVDKPPGAFWVQALFAWLFGVSPWSVNLPQAIAGSLAPGILYFLMRREFGRVSAVAAASVLVVVPASIVIDSRNEPDGLLIFALLLAAVCIVRAAETGKWRWLLAFGFFVGFAFNAKMLVAFVPLPAFLLYYLLRAQASVRQLAFRVAAAMAVLLVVSFSWATFVALTPASERPYIGSTRDNSIWTLVFRYNGLDRFNSFLGPRATQPQAGAIGGPNPQPGGPLPYQPGPGGTPQQQTPPYQPSEVSQGPSPANANASDRGIAGLFANPLAAQLGWLMPGAVLTLAVALASLLPEGVYRRPFLLLSVFRNAPGGAEAILWTGWFVTAALVFGVADATTTHPYYLADMGVPVAAVLGIGFGALWQGFRRGVLLAWTVPPAVLAIAGYEALLSQGAVGDLIMGIVLITVVLACTVMAAAVWNRLTDTPLASYALAAGAGALLIIPLVFGLHFGGRIAGAGVGQAGPARGLPAGPDPRRELAIAAFVRQEGDAGSRFAIGMLSAREAAPFIIRGIPAVAIGGFSGGDPIFTLASFRSFAQQGNLRYFLMSPGGEGAAGPAGRPQMQPIINYVRTTWLDVSDGAGLPRGSLYKYQGP